MSSGADWKNTQQQSMNKASPLKGKNQGTNMNSRENKYKQL